MKLLVLIAVLVACAAAASTLNQLPRSKNVSKGSFRCKAPPVSPQKVEKVINQCQDEVKLAIIQEALESLQEVKEEEQKQQGIQRVKRQVFSKDEKKIAGCLLQCVYRQVKAVDQLGFPETQGLIKLYTEGGDDPEYISATTRAVHACLAISSRVIAERYQEPGLACDVSYDVFECVTNKVAEYCGTI
ncbi:general odorant-binding protein 70 [Neocloeon triangulifer]|uniref:general odorant-binding protein 70 n=1 Tax=Neocloeon triangulifer TaxID=2078957 RepID=UPI00286F9B4A|nr:general odorant-binding protein 70 [Neocloeon triangulifer]